MIWMGQKLQKAFHLLAIKFKKILARPQEIVDRNKAETHLKTFLKDKSEDLATHFKKWRKQGHHIKGPHIDYFPDHFINFSDKEFSLTKEIKNYLHHDKKYFGLAWCIEELALVKLYPVYGSKGTLSTIMVVDTCNVSDVFSLKNEKTVMSHGINRGIISTDQSLHVKYLKKILKMVIKRSQELDHLEAQGKQILEERRRRRRRVLFQE